MTEPKSSPVGAEFGDLLKRADRLVAAVPHQPDLGKTVADVAEVITLDLGGRLGVSGGRVYRRAEEGESYQLLRTFGAAHPIDNPPLCRATTRRWRCCARTAPCTWSADDPRLDRELENALGAGRFAAIEVGDGRVPARLRPRTPSASARTSLLLARASCATAINQKIVRERMDDVLREARKIQASILPRRLPDYGSFDLAGRNEPMETVGGDFFDFIPLSPKDHGHRDRRRLRPRPAGGAAGARHLHGPAHGPRPRLQDRAHGRAAQPHHPREHPHLALRVDVLRRARAQRRTSSTSTPAIRRRSTSAPTATSRFLESGGAVLGPLADASYERGFVLVQPGDLLVLYTDGIIEARPRGGRDEYGVDRLVEVVRALPAQAGAGDHGGGVRRRRSASPTAARRRTIAPWWWCATRSSRRKRPRRSAESHPRHSRSWR